MEHEERLKAALADRYEIEWEIGSGGMAVVYLAQGLESDRPVTLKVLQPEMAHSLGADRFLREIQIAAKLTHPHILPLHESGEADWLLHYTMPYESVGRHYYGTAQGSFRFRKETCSRGW